MPRVSREGAHARPSGAGWLVAVAATLGMSVSYVDRQTLAAIAPAVRAGIGIDHAQFGWLVSAFSMAYLVAAPVAGSAVDRLGARLGFAAAVVAWTVVAGLHALATSFAVLFALRVLLGVTEAPSFPAAAQAIRRSLPGARGTAAYGLLFTGSSLGAMLAAPLAVALEARYGFRFAFLGTAVVGAAWLPLWLWATARGGLHGPRAEPRAPIAAPSDLRAVVTSAPVQRAVVAVVGSAPALMFVLNWTPQYLVEVWKLPRTEIGGLLVVPPLLFDLGAVGFGWLGSARTPRGRHGTHTDLLLGCALLATTLVLVPLAPSPTIALLLLGVSAAGGGGIYVLVTSDMLGRVPVARTSSAGGVTAAAQSLAHIVAAPLVGRSVDATHGFGPALVALAVVVLPTTLAFVAWPVPARLDDA